VCVVWCGVCECVYVCVCVVWCSVRRRRAQHEEKTHTHTGAQE
jgi:hypothetical protein